MSGDGEIRWGTIIPLIGGSAIGCQQATGRLPEYHLSYSPFANNEKHIKKYWPSVPFCYLDKNQRPAATFQNVDFINSVCPCAGLSMLNTASSGGKKRGADAEANRWMYESSIYVLANVRPKVLWGENAPGLFTNIGEGVIEKLRQIGRQFGYSFSVMKTNTDQHGIPQSRPRTFYFFWRSPTVPMMEYCNKERKDLTSYLADIPTKASQQEMFLVEGQASQRFRPYQFVLEREGKTHQEFAKEIGKGTITTYLEKHNLIDECIDWLNKNYPGESVWTKTGRNRTHVDYLEHVKRKREAGLGYWDDSPRFTGECFATVMKKTMMWGIHPEKDRFLSAREFMHLMGLPHDFEIEDERSLNHIAQNVPVCTAKDMASQVIKFIKGELPMTEECFIKQDNILGRITEAERGEVGQITDEEALDPQRFSSIMSLLLLPAQVKTEEGGEEKVQRKRSLKTVLSEEERQHRKIDKEIAREKKREAKRLEKEKLKEEKEEKSKRKKLQSEREREERKSARELKGKTETKPIMSAKKMKTENSDKDEISWENASEEQRKFACYICRAFPRPGSLSRSELYRHYSTKHFRDQLRDSFLSQHSLPCPCPYCPEDKAKILTKNNFWVSHVGQVHLLVENYIDKVYHVPGDIRRRNQIKVEVEKTEDETIKTEDQKFITEDHRAKIEDKKVKAKGPAIKTEEHKVNTKGRTVQTEAHILADELGRRLVEKEIEITKEDHEEMEVTNIDHKEVETKRTLRPRQNLNQKQQLAGKRKRPTNDNLRKNNERIRRVED